MKFLQTRRAELTFLLVGSGGFLVDILVLMLLRKVGVPFFISRAVSFSTSVVFTWLLNRKVTFRSNAHGMIAVTAEFARYYAASCVGGSLNYLVSISMVALRDYGMPWEFFATVCGTLTGLVFNFVIYKRHIFA